MLNNDDDDDDEYDEFSYPERKVHLIQSTGCFRLAETQMIYFGYKKVTNP